MTVDIDRMHAVMAGWPGRVDRDITHVCKYCRYWTGRSAWRGAANFLTFGFWNVPEWGTCRSRLSHHTGSKTWALMGCGRWRAVLRKNAPEPTDDTVRRDLRGQREAELAGELPRSVVVSVAWGFVLFIVVAVGLAAANLIHGALR